MESRAKEHRRPLKARGAGKWTLPWNLGCRPAGTWASAQGKPPGPSDPPCGEQRAFAEVLQDHPGPAWIAKISGRTDEEKNCLQVERALPRWEGITFSTLVAAQCAGEAASGSVEQHGGKAAAEILKGLGAGWGRALNLRPWESLKEPAFQLWV